MKIAIRFKDNKITEWKYPCESFEEKLLIIEGFALYEFMGETKDIQFLQLVGDKLEVNQARKQAVEDMQKKTCEREAIESWFKEYDRKVSEHSRCVRLDIPCHHDISSLDAEAVIKAKRLKELREAESEI